jgi:SAM-dependent methyltransferase
VENKIAKSKLFIGTKVNICKKCHVSWINEKISEEILLKYYKQEYSEWRRKEGLSPKEYFENKKNLVKAYRAKTQLELAKSYLEGYPSNVLDIGCGPGTLLYLAKAEYFPKVNLFGLEPDDYAQDNLRYLNTTVYASLDEIPANFFDLVVMSHILEHYDITNIWEILDCVRKALSKKGILLLEVPNADFVKYPEKINQNQEPHLSFFSIDALRILLRKSGFSIDFEKTVGKPLRKSWFWYWSKFKNMLFKFFGNRKRMIYGRDYRSIRVIARNAEKQISISPDS